MALNSNASPQDLLKDVSRSFFLTLRVLPATIRPQISLAYLLARTTDTIADTELVPLEQRLQALRALRERILGSRETQLDFGDLARQQGSPAERAILEKVETSTALLQTFPSADRQMIREVLDTITSGQELDLHRFAGASAANVIALRTDEQLDDYTYRVAGCVGEFWTKMCRAHVFPKAPLDDAFLLANGVRFGKGLQLVNILRDLPADLRQGRCYLPAEGLSACGLQPEDLLDAANSQRLQGIYNEWLGRAENHLLAGWAYTNELPRGSVRIRLACAWPILIGLETIKRLRASNPLDSNQRVKISRREVKRIILRTVLLYPFGKAWKGIASRLLLR